MGFAVLINILSDLVWVLLGILLAAMLKYYLQTNPSKILWGFSNPRKLIICVAASTRTDTGEYHRPATGIGQLRAVAQIVPKLYKAYKHIHIENVVLSCDQIQSSIENDCILIGGPKNNELTAKFLDRIKSLNIVEQDDKQIYWFSEGEKTTYHGTIDNKTVTTDYGIGIRMRNPFSSKGTRIVLFSGGHTYGSIAAAIYFTQLVSTKTIRKKKNYDFFYLVSCDVIDGYPVNIQLVNECWRRIS